MNSQFDESDQPGQSIEEIMQIVAEATVPPAGTQSLNQYLTGETRQNITKEKKHFFSFFFPQIPYNVTIQEAWI